MNLITKTFGHLKTITEHKIKVGILCFKCGLYKQGLLHDCSKYSWIEFSSSVKYFQGDRSPYDKEKELYGYSLGWLHHKGRNKHHWEYWLDRTKGELVVAEMPKKYIKESVCDRVAACKIYQKEHYTDSSPITYFKNGTDHVYMHPNSSDLLRKYLTWIEEFGLNEGLKLIKKD